jgi:hypothetical protein
MNNKWLAGLAFLGITSSAIAAVTIDDDGKGFVGKGDVQLAFEWNNAQLQANAESLEFSVSAVSEVSWTCTNASNDNVQVRERTTTTAGLVSSVARRQNQTTGFNLTGFAEGATTSSEGPPLNSCPSGPWSLTIPAGDPVLVEGGGLVVCLNGSDCKALAITQ